MHHDDIGQPRGADHRRDVPQGIGIEIAVERGVDRMRRHDLQQRVTFGGRLGDRLGPDVAAGADSLTCTASHRAALGVGYTRLVERWKSQCILQSTGRHPTGVADCRTAAVLRVRYNKNDRADSQACSTLRASNSSARVLPRFTAVIGIPALAAIWTKRKPE